jgi:hypothetical protein
MKIFLFKKQLGKIPNYLIESTGVVIIAESSTRAIEILERHITARPYEWSISLLGKTIGEIESGVICEEIR